jgi:hypothetical protein
MKLVGIVQILFSQAGKKYVRIETFILDKITIAYQIETMV